MNDIINLRDAGGSEPVPLGMLYRSSAPGELDADGKATLHRLGLRSIVDLRDLEELRSMPLAELDGAVTVHNPIYRGRVTLSTIDDMAVWYSGVLDDCAAEIGSVVSFLAQPNRLPTLVHCSMGKDRTGIVVAVILSALGASDDTVAADYAKTSESYTGAHRDEILSRGAKLGIDPERVELLFGSPASAMHDLLAHLRRRYGNVDGYLSAAGVAPGAVADLRAAMCQLSP